MEPSFTCCKEEEREKKRKAAATCNDRLLSLKSYKCAEGDITNTKDAPVEIEASNDTHHVHNTTSSNTPHLDVALSESGNDLYGGIVDAYGDTSQVEASSVIEPGIDTVRYAITFGEVAILHIGTTEYGSKRREVGFTVTELEELAQKVNTQVPGCAEVFHISEVLPPHLQTQENQAATLVIRNGASFVSGRHDFANKLLEEQKQSVSYDRKYYDVRTRRTKNKRARYNVVFGEEELAHNDDYTRCTVKSFAKLPYLCALRSALSDKLGERAQGLSAEGNLYYDDACGIGFHGDSERKVVICVSLGKRSCLRYHWRLPRTSAHTLPPVDIEVGHGDIYVMSEKATGYDWRFSSKVRVVHAAGAAKYIGQV